MLRELQLTPAHDVVSPRVECVSERDAFGGALLGICRARRRAVLHYVTGVRRDLASAHEESNCRRTALRLRRLTKEQDRALVPNGTGPDSGRRPDVGPGTTYTWPPRRPSAVAPNTAHAARPRPGTRNQIPKTNASTVKK